MKGGTFNVAMSPGENVDEAEFRLWLIGDDERSGGGSSFYTALTATRGPG